MKQYKITIEYENLQDHKLYDAIFEGSDLQALSIDIAKLLKRVWFCDYKVEVYDSGELVYTNNSNNNNGDDGFSSGYLLFECLESLDPSIALIEFYNI